MPLPLILFLCRTAAKQPGRRWCTPLPAARGRGRAQLLGGPPLPRMPLTPSPFPSDAAAHPTADGAPCPPAGLLTSSPQMRRQKPIGMAPPPAAALIRSPTIPSQSPTGHCGRAARSARWLWRCAASGGDGGDGRRRQQDGGGVASGGARGCEDYNSCGPPRLRH
jgi:hypothetical protein